jgi:hypothetical protein
MDMNMDIDPIDGGPRPSVAPPIPALTARDNRNTVHVSLNSPLALSPVEEAKLTIDQLQSEDVSNRVAAAHRLDRIALTLGPERTREVSESQVCQIFPRSEEVINPLKNVAADI